MKNRDEDSWREFRDKDSVKTKSSSLELTHTVLRGFTGNTEGKWHVGGRCVLHERNGSTIRYYDVGGGKKIHIKTVLETV